MRRISGIFRFGTSPFLIAAVLAQSQTSSACPDIGTELKLGDGPLIEGMTTKVRSNGGARVSLSMQTILKRDPLSRKPPETREDSYHFSYDREKEGWNFTQVEGGKVEKIFFPAARGGTVTLSNDDNSKYASACLYFDGASAYLYRPNSDQAFPRECPEKQAAILQLSSHKTAFKTYARDPNFLDSMGVYPQKINYRGEDTTYDQLGELDVKGNKKVMTKSASIPKKGPAAVAFDKSNPQYIKVNCEPARPKSESTSTSAEIPDSENPRKSERAE